MEKIVKRNGKVYLVQDFEMKGFETYYYLGLDPDYIEEDDTKKEVE